MKKLFAVTALGVAALFTGVDKELSIIPQAYAEQSQEVHQTTGVVKSVDQEKGRITLAHDPVPSLKWPSMTMGFAVADKALLENVDAGEKVKFMFIKGDGGKFVVTQIDSVE